MAKVSIVVPIYNVEKYVAKCLDSLITQTFSDIEIWAVSDGTPDNSMNIVRQYATKDNRIKVIEKENGGYGSVLEYTIANMTSDYFLVCDPDDWLEPNTVEVLYNKAIKNDLDIVYGSYYLVYADDLKKEYCSGVNYPEIFNPIDSEVYTERLGRFSFLTPSPHAKLYKTAITKNIQFPHKVSFTDWVLYTIAIYNSKKIAYLKEPLANYLVDRPGNTMTDIKPTIIDYHSQVFHSILNQYRNLHIEDQYFYFKMFTKFKSYYKEALRIENKEDYFSKYYLLLDMLKPLVVKRKEIRKLFYIYGAREKLICDLLLHPWTYKIVFKIFYRRNFKKK